MEILFISLGLSLFFGLIIGYLIHEIIINKHTQANLLNEYQNLNNTIQDLYEENQQLKNGIQEQLENQYQNEFRELELLKDERACVWDDLNKMKAEQTAINAEILRRREIEEKKDFYRICLSTEAKTDIENLEKIRPLLTNKEALDKLIYNEFIRRPLDLMEKRVLKGSISGIYKITRLKTGEIYIGRSTDVMKRWTEHIKSALGIGTIAHSYLHTVMAQDGLDQFTFELIEQCEKSQLNTREKFYIDFYGSKILLNEKAGG